MRRTTSSTCATIPLDRFGRLGDLSALPASPSGGDLALAAGSYGAAGPMLVSSAASGGPVSQSARVLAAVASEAVPGGPLSLRVRAKLDAPLAVGGSLTVAARRLDAAGGVGADLVQSPPAALGADWADCLFVLDGDGVGPGDVLDVKLTLDLDDTGGSTGAAGRVADCRLVLTARS